MALLSLSLPVIGQSNATEDQKTRDALVAIQSQINGQLDSTNIAAAYMPMAVGAFSAYVSAAQSRVTGEMIVFDGEEWDAGPNWHIGGVYTPQAAGVYQFSWLVTSSAAFTVDNYWVANLYKNSVRYKAAKIMNYRTALAGVTSGGTAEAQANGTTDRFEIRVFHNQGVPIALSAGLADTYFQGHMIGR